MNKKHSYIGIEELILADEYLINYNKFIVSLIINSLNFKSIKNTVDFGSGIGTLAKIFYEKTNNKPLCIEIDDKGIKYLKTQKFKVFNSLNEISCKIYNVYSSNVLEHIKNDKKIVQEIYNKLEYGGKLILYLPAKEIIYSDFDKRIGHYRRYEKNKLINMLQDANFKVLKIDYCDSLGFFASFITKLIGYKEGKGLASPSALKIYDNLVFPVSKVLDFCGMRKIFGKNLFVVCEKSKL